MGHRERRNHPLNTFNVGLFCLCSVPFCPILYYPSVGILFISLYRLLPHLSLLIYNLFLFDILNRHFGFFFSFVIHFLYGELLYST